MSLVDVNNALTSSEQGLGRFRSRAMSIVNQLQSARDELQAAYDSKASAQAEVAIYKSTLESERASSMQVAIERADACNLVFVSLIENYDTLLASAAGVDWNS
ncbi:hypothetical protein [Teredinibacter purpureus]|uniref:hypothetical protein n=1 Tax=Teredinibacter purpureus TaxID=2731756 RepID=UPI0005F7784D|nr:hypothetical protein [Teredinibacter purpureus]